MNSEWPFEWNVSNGNVSIWVLSAFAIAVELPSIRSSAGGWQCVNRQPAIGNWQLAIRLVRESFSIKLSNLLRLPSGRKPLRDTARSSNDARSSSTPSTPEYHSISTAIDYRFPTFLLLLLIPSRCRLSPSPFFSIQRVAGRHFVATLTIPLLPLSLLHFPTSPKHWATNIEQCAN